MRLKGSLLLFVVTLSTTGCTGNVRETTQGSKGGEPGGSEGGVAGSDSGSAGSGGTVSSCTANQVTVGGGKWRRLTRLQYRNTVRDLLGVGPDTSNFLAESLTGAFSTNALPPQENDIGAYASAAEAIAETVTRDPTKLLACDMAALGNDACAAKFIKDFTARAYRRDPSPTEINGLTDLYNAGKADGVDQGLKLVVQAILQSPSFLYLAEFGGAGDDNKLTSNEVATRLSYLLWNTTPDATLLTAAKSGALDSEGGIQTQAKRLMADGRFARTVAEFHRQLFHMNRLVDGKQVTKTNAADLPDSLRQAMVDEVDAFVAYVLGSGQPTVRNLLTAKVGFPSGPLLDVYKVQASQLSNGRYDVKDRSRAGLLTSPALMATEPPTPTPYGVVQRGKMVRTMLLCEQLPPPPMNLKFVTPPDAATTPQRTLLEQHKNNPTCAGCHTLMDPIGFGFENYDGLGRYRTSYPKGETIDPSGEILGDSDIQGPFEDMTELASRLAGSQQVRACLGTHWFRFAYGREPVAQDACALEKFSNALGTKDGDLPSSLLAFVVSDAFRFRQGVQK